MSRLGHFIPIMLLAVVMASMPGATHCTDIPKPVPLRAAELYPHCVRDDNLCKSFMLDVRATMRGSPEIYGVLCETGQWTDDKGRPVDGTPPDMLALMFLHARDQRWFDAASAHDAAVWVIQGNLECTVQQIAEPGDANFPSKLRPHR